MWRDRILAWECSDLSQAEYCQQNNLKVSQFWRWKSRFKRAGVATKERNLAPAKPFVAVAITGSDSALVGKAALVDDAGVVLVVGPDIEIHLSRDFDPAVLVNAVRALRAL